MGSLPPSVTLRPSVSGHRQGANASVAARPDDAHMETLPSLVTGRPSALGLILSQQETSNRSVNGHDSASAAISPSHPGPLSASPPTAATCPPPSTGPLNANLPTVALCPPPNGPLNANQPTVALCPPTAPCPFTRLQLASQFRRYPELFARRDLNGFIRQPTHVLETKCLRCSQDFEVHPDGMSPEDCLFTTPSQIPESPRTVTSPHRPYHGLVSQAAPARTHSAMSLSSVNSHFDETQSKIMEKMVKFTAKIKAFDPSITPNCRPFLESIRLALYSSGVDSIHWYRILPRLVQGEHVERWVQLKIVEATPSPASWEAACDMFMAHYQRVNYKAVLAIEYANLKQTSSVQDFADRFRTLASQLNKDPTDEQSYQDFLNRVQPHIEMGYKQMANTYKLLTGSDFEPRNLDHVIELCIAAEQSQQKSITNLHFIEEQRKRAAKEHLSTTPQGTDKTSQDSSGSKKWCEKHGFGSHDTSQCRHSATSAVKPSTVSASSSSSPNAAKTSQASTLPTSTDKIYCYTCRQPGHKVTDCPLTKRAPARVGTLSFGQTPDSDTRITADVLDLLLDSEDNSSYEFESSNDLNDVPHVNLLTTSNYPNLTDYPTNEVIIGTTPTTDPPIEGSRHTGPFTIKPFEGSQHTGSFTIKEEEDADGFIYRTLHPLEPPANKRQVKRHHSTTLGHGGPDPSHKRASHKTS